MSPSVPARPLILAVALGQLLGLPPPALGAASPEGRQSFRGGRAAAGSGEIAVKEFEATLRSILEASHSGEDSPLARRLAEIEASMSQTFQALPKNAVGRLAPRAARYLVHGYFAKEHGWLVNGLEPHGMRTDVTEVHEVTILQDKAPALAASLLGALRSGRGLALADAAAMAALVERLVLDESLALLEAAYRLNGRPVDEPVGDEELHEILSSYLLIYEMGFRSNLTDVRLHQAIKAQVAASGSTWPTLVDFGRDALLNFGYRTRHAANPFVERRFPFEAAAGVAEDLARGYGKWQDAECRRMKEDLMDLDRDGMGRIALSVFYSRPQSAEYQFTESVEYLRRTGALEEGAGRDPRVRVANYLLGPSNCIASSTYYSVCCLNECDGLMSELEGSVQAPEASPERLLALVQNLSSSSISGPRRLPSEMADRLSAIAERHGGAVPLHGRLFAQWLHLAFPHECPFPHVAADDGEALTAARWLDGRAIASAEERGRHVESVRSAREDGEEDGPPSLQWSDEEVLPLHEPPRPRGALGAALPAAAQVAAGLVVLRMAAAGWAAAARASAGGAHGQGKEKRELELPW